jgi:hypothetical protein
MEFKDLVAFAAFAFSIVSFARSLWIKSRTRRDEKVLEAIAREEAAKARLLQALQGDKESVGYTALHFAQEGLPEAQTHRKQVILALVEASVFTGVRSGPRYRLLGASAKRKTVRSRNYSSHRLIRELF